MNDLVFVLESYGTPLYRVPARLDLLQEVVGHPRLSSVRLETSAGDDLGLSLPVERLRRGLSKSDADSRLREYLQGDQVQSALRGVRLMRRALDEDYTPEEREAIEQALDQLVSKTYFERLDVPVVRRGKSLRTCFARSDRIAYQLFPVDRDEGYQLPVILNGKAVVEIFTGDEGGSSGALGVSYFRSGRFAGRYHVSAIYSSWLRTGELSLPNDEIADRRFIEVMSGQNVWTRPPAGWA